MSIVTNFGIKASKDENIQGTQMLLSVYISPKNLKRIYERCGGNPEDIHNGQDGDDARCLAKFRVYGRTATVYLSNYEGEINEDEKLRFNIGGHMYELDGLSFEANLKRLVPEVNGARAVFSDSIFGI